MKEKKIQKWLRFISIPLYFLTLLGLSQGFQLLYGFVSGATIFSKINFVFSALWALLFSSVALLLPRLLSRIFMLLTVSFYGLLTMVHAVMYHMFGSFFRISDVIYAGDGAAFFNFSYIHMRKSLVLVVLLAVICTVFAVILLPKLKYSKKRVLIGLAAMAISFGGIFLLDRKLGSNKSSQSFSWDVAITGGNEAIYTDFVNPNRCLPLTGIYQYTFRDCTKELFPSTDDISKREELDAYFSQRTSAVSNDMTGILQGKNVIMVMVESLDTWMLTPDYMPNLYALQQKSLDFSHFYTPLYLPAGTFSTEFASLTGIIPAQTGASNTAYATNKLPYALPRLFSEQGYTANSFHGSVPAIYNRGEIHKNLGFEAYHSYVDMGMDDYMLDSQMLRAFDQMTADGPFFTYVITISGHGAYDETMASNGAAFVEQARKAVAQSGVSGPEETMREYTQAISQIMETDAFFGGLVAKLEEAELLDDTVIIVYGDHYGKYMSDKDFLMDLKQVDNRNLLCNTPFFIYSSLLPAQKVEKYAATVDVFPTLCNLFGFDVPLEKFVGDDIFGTQGGIVYWPDYSWYDGDVYIDGTNPPALTDDQAKISSMIQGKLNASWNTLRYNWFAYQSVK